MPPPDFAPDQIWDDESDTPPALSAVDFDARLEASNQRRAKEIVEAEARNRELAELTARKEALLARLQLAFDEAKRESETINRRVAALNNAARRAQNNNMGGMGGF